MAYETLYIVWSVGNISLHPFYRLRISALAVILPFASWSLYLILRSLWFSKAELKVGTVCLWSPCVNPSVILCTLHWNHFSSCQKKHGPLDDGTALLTVCLVSGILFSTHCLKRSWASLPPFLVWIVQYYWDTILVLMLCTLNAYLQNLTVLSYWFSILGSSLRNTELFTCLF